jgi:hypothetical protein
MILKMTDRVMVILTGLGIKIYKKKCPELEKVYGRTGLPKVVVHDGKSVMRSTMRMLFAIYGDHMASKERHKRVFVHDTLLFEDLESQATVEDLPDSARFRIDPLTGVPKLESVRPKSGPRVIRPTTLTVKHVEDTKRPILYDDSVAPNKTEE